MKACNTIRNLFLISLSAGILVSGCGTMKSLYKASSSALSAVPKKILPGHDPIFKKKVLLLPFLDQAGVGEESIKEITTKMVRRLREDPYLIVHESKTPISVTGELKSPQFGIVIDPQLAQRAEEMGMHVLITGILSPYELFTKKTGIWPFKKVKKEIEISLIVNVLDITNGTLYLSNIEQRKIKIAVEADEEELMEEWKFDIRLVSKDLDEILDEQAEAIRETLRQSPWTGRLVSVDGTRIMINAGKEVGIKDGILFEVFGEGESIRSSSGQTYYYLGPKMGEIKTTEAMEGYAAATVLSGDALKPGMVIRFKED